MGLDKMSRKEFDAIRWQEFPLRSERKLGSKAEALPYVPDGPK